MTATVTPAMQSTPSHEHEDGQDKIEIVLSNSAQAPNDEVDGDTDVVAIDAADASGDETSAMTESEAVVESRRMKALVGAIFVCIVAFVVIDSFTTQYIRTGIQAFLGWTKHHKALGVLAFTGVYFLSAVIFVPGALMTVGGGFIFTCAFGMKQGILLGTISVFLGASAGAIWAFLLGRYLLRDKVIKMTERHRKFEALDNALEQKGLRIMLLLRLSPIMPFNFINLASGVTSISLSVYSLALIGLLPGVVLFVFLGASASTLTEMNQKLSPLNIVALVCGVAFGIIGIAACTYYARKELKTVCERRDSAKRQSAIAMANVRPPLPDNDTEEDTAIIQSDGTLSFADM